ncbi:putative ubiquitin-conjugating enzyme E2 38 [Quercus robur]|uniref:putative ubiquitin-conjugating enzyme E2 38 n=1 Tax=Quercus robur TaxID=38942 RepID=UPI0021632120|nr:putative ubiquitin-conjugating enzyme E2 38 [Quercus robur]
MSTTTTKSTTCNGEIEEELKNALSFKQFDVVSDDSDHHYLHSHNNNNNKKDGRDCIIAPSSQAHKKIVQEWRILEKNLPDSILVRVYENRVDLLRAVIVGAAGTPYHDGLYFFDFSFPPDYPTRPPHVYYRSHGLRLNPNMYANGRVCLSLLNTWTGKKSEKWNPNESTVLQILVSIQALVLNEKPYFNEPGHSMLGRAIWEKKSQAYNEDVFLLSCKTMLFLLRRPPRNFEVFVGNHFRDRADSILRACIAYMDGFVRVGYYENNNDNDGSSSSSSSSVEVSDRFKASMEKLYSELLIAFQRCGASVGNFVERLKVEKRTTPSRAPQVAVKKKKKKQPGIAKKVIWKLKKVLGVGKSKAGVGANGIVGT